MICPMSTLIFFLPKFFQCVTYNQAIAYTITPKEIVLSLPYIFGVQMFLVFPEVPSM